MGTEVVNRQRRVRIDGKRIAQLADRTLEAAGHPSAVITVAFVRDSSIRRLNRDYRGKDHATDVLSFPTDDEQSLSLGEVQLTGVENVYLGDVVISTDTAVSQSEESGCSIERELSELVIHGALHLCGYDHETDQGEMNRLELKLRRKLLTEN